MYTHPQHGGGTAVKNLRKAGGSWLKQCRLRKGLTQRDIAEAVGLEYYTTISMIEAGRGRIPPTSYTLWAKALGFNPRDFVREIMRYYDPISYNILFSDNIDSSVPQNHTIMESMD